MMKRYSIIYLFLFVTTLFSCEEYLDVNPEMGVSSEEVYSEYTSFRGAVDLAARLVYNPASSNLSTRGYRPGSYSDEGQCSNLSKPLGSHNLGGYEWQIMDAGFYSNSNPTKDIKNNTPSGSAVQAIRAVNQALANADKLTKFPLETEFTEEELKNQLFGQCYFYRAYFYFEVIRRMGPMPKMDKVFATDDNFDEARPTYQQSTDWLVEDLDQAIALLPENWNLQNKGRPTKTSAKALKAWALLFAASPNMNLPFGVTPTGGEGYNTDYLEKAVAASVEALKSAEANADYRLYNWDEYSEIWTSTTNALPLESIFQPTVKAGTIKWGKQDGNAWFRPPFDGGWTGNTIYPTQNAVDWFETVDGWDINDAPATSYDSQDPYSNRDPRLRELIYVNGDDMYLKPSATHKHLQSYVSYDPAVPNGYHYEFMVKKNSLIWTGYVLKGKHRWPGCNTQDQKGTYRCFPIIRFAQLYLDLAEAANELYGPEGQIPGANPAWDTSLKAINIIRDRATMPVVRSEYTGSKDQFRKRIRNERAVELFWEGHRWNDIKRWRIAKDVLKEIRGANITMTNGVIKYGTKVLPGVRVFEDKHYWYPFSQSTEDMMLVFEQNPGW